MTGLRTTEEITFYEELGVESGASPEEIRDAFRSLVRLLHPDQQTDPQLKEIAEKQMRKLNRIYAVLSDAESRRRYDDSLHDDFAPAVIVNPSWPVQKQVVGRLAWVGAILVSAALLVWLAAENAPEPAGRARYQNADSAYIPNSSAKTSSPADQSSQLSRLTSDLRVVTAERDAAIRELNKLRGSASSTADSGNSAPPDVIESRPAGSPRPAAATPPAVTIAELPSNTKVASVVPPEPARVERAPNRRLGGFWFYVKPPHGQQNKNRALYPPEFIEVTISEENGAIYGRYRARFQIIDRAISPDVNFTFQGADNGSQNAWQWSGPGGAKGDLTLKLASENTLRIDWTATELGTQLGLNSGTAVLSRRVD
jgi:curved DNA-binding protein CbpA